MSLKNFSLRRKTASPSAPEPLLEKNEESSSLKRGDEKRIMLMNMVKEGKLSVDNALQRAYGMGIASVPYEELDIDTMNHEKEGEIYNFGVHRYGRNNKSVKCVIQIDFQEDSVSLLQRGLKLKSYPFKALKNVISGDDSTRLVIQFDDLNETEIDAATFEEKNRIARLLLMIIGQMHTGFPVHSDSIIGKRKEVIKEGVLDKKGHSAAFLMWPKRFVRLLHGEMMYFKVGEEKNESSALSIVSLNDEETSVRKLDENGFLLVTNEREYAFRLSSNKSEEIEKERNDWIIAIQEAVRGPKVNYVPTQQNDLLHQEEYLKSIATSLNDELEQLGVMLNIIDAPIRASTQVKKVREIVSSLNNQINTGLLSWTLKHAKTQRLSMAEANFEGEATENCMHDVNDISPYTSINYSHLDLANKTKHVSKTSDELYNQLNISTNHNEDHRLSIQSNLSNDSRYSPYPNYRAPSISEIPVEDGPYAQYSPVMLSDSSFSTYAKVNKKVKQKQSNNPYVNIDRRYFDMQTWSEDPPPLPPKMSDTELENTSYSDPSANLPISSTNENKKKQSGQGDDQYNFRDHLNVGEQTTKIPKTPNVLQSQDPPTKLNNDVHPIGDGNIPAPPPPPGIIMSTLPSKDDVIPNCKLKPLFWTKVPDMQIGNTVWKNAEDRLKNLSTEKLESLFHSVQPNEQPDGKALGDILVSKEEKATSKSLLDPKKAQNLGIFLSGFKLNDVDIEEKLSIFDDENGFTSDEINALKRFQPTAEEVEMFKTFKGDITKLVNVDMFIFKLCNITNLNTRLDLLLTIREIPDQVQDIEPPVNNLLDACKSLKNNKGFFRILEYILSLGNYLNGGTNRGRAHGFRLSALVKLVDIRSSDKKQTLLQFLAEELYAKDQEALMCYKEMTSLLTPTDISVKGLTAEVEIMTKDIDKLNKQVKSLSFNFDQTFVDNVNEFIATYSEKLISLQNQCKEIVKLSSELKRMYGETPSSDFGNWLNHVSDFVKQLQRAAEAAEQKQQRLSNRQKRESALITAESIEHQIPLKDISFPKLDWNDKIGVKNNRREKEVYETIVTHTTKMSKNTLESHAKLYSVNQASVLQLSSADSLEELSFPTKTGFLEKESGGMKWNRKWDYRFFELTTTGYLHYSKQEDGKLSGAIYLRGSPVEIDANDPCIIEIHHEQRVWKLRGDNDLEVLDWFNALVYYAQMDSLDI